MDDTSAFLKIFGPGSPLSTKFINNEVGMTVLDYMGFMAALFTSCSRNRSAKRLIEDTCFDWRLMTNDEYNKMWKHLNSFSGAGAREEAMWMRTETAINETLRSLAMSSRDDYRYVIAIDDDKVHYNYDKWTKCFGIGKKHHNKDNR